MPRSTSSICIPFFVAALARLAEPGGDRDVENVDTGTCTIFPRAGQKWDTALDLLADHRRMEYVSLPWAGIMERRSSGIHPEDTHHLVYNAHAYPLVSHFPHSANPQVSVATFRNELHRPRLIFPP